ncbi:hypothetical protein [Deinococcus radiopugnans]|uniref:Uncharacterized protein n=1 Tax=Deinococcus radiopugnans ATCC 19172 TaxID=585398 RepID=A0A5C4XXH5_9DEIO|nr:hypothetical protein [Deinococcus radiopugnans]MBB6018523.1 hypothetical protein [Deinococcus radiopugnans ATCC 19172]TNM67391.1 hypothetical protein FHR04_18355 [Deinococcus radiopugnans ATCC 19172]
MKAEPIWALHRLRLGRGVKATWETWKSSGALLMGLYLGVAALIGLVSVWQTGRVPQDAPDATVLAGLAAAWWGSAVLVRRPVLALNTGDALLLRTPLRPWQVWLAPWLVQVGPVVLAGVALGVLLWVWWPTWWTAALGLPLGLLGWKLGQALWSDARTVGDHATQRRLRPLFLVPLIGALHPALLPVALLGGVLGLGWLWWTFWQADVPARVVLHAQVEALRRGAIQLGLPAPDIGTDGTRPARRWTLALRGSGVFQASVWRSSLHLLRRPGLLLLAVPVGLLMVVLSPTFGAGLDPMTLRAMPGLFSPALAALLVTLGPILPQTLPLSGWGQRLARVLPAGVVLGGLLGLGTLGAAALGWAPASLVGAALLMPGVALSLLAWLGQAGPASLSSDGKLRYAAATAPALLTVLLGGWLAPAGLLLLGGLALLLPGSA